MAKINPLTRFLTGEIKMQRIGSNRVFLLPTKFNAHCFFSLDKFFFSPLLNLDLSCGRSETKNLKNFLIFKDAEKLQVKGFIFGSVDEFGSKTSFIEKDRPSKFFLNRIIGIRGPLRIPFFFFSFFFLSLFRKRAELSAINEHVLL